jgi:hypothetical membrane protein
MLHRLRSSEDRHPAIGPLLCIASIQYFVLQLVVALQWSPPYSISRNTVSDLGVTTCGRFNARYVCSPLHDVMNLSFVLLGATMITACALLHRSLQTQRPRLLRVGFVLVGSGGVGVLLVGIFPENSVPLIHGIGAALPFVLGNIGVAVLGFSLPVPLAFRLFTLTVGFAALTALMFYATSHFLGFGEGGMERIVAYPQTVWLIALGVLLLTNDASDPIGVERKKSQ